MGHPDLINVADASRCTPLGWAVRRGDIAAVSLLLKYGATVSTSDLRIPSVATVVSSNHVECFRLMLSASPDPTICCAPGNIGRPLNHAARNADDAEILEVLLEYGADVNAQGVDGSTPLIHAARRNKLDFAKVLVNAGASLDQACVAGPTALAHAVVYNAHEVLKYLCDVERKRDRKTCYAQDLLTTAARYADAETMRILGRFSCFVFQSALAETLFCQQSSSFWKDRLAERWDSSPELCDSFDSLLANVGDAFRETKHDLCDVSEDTTRLLEILEEGALPTSLQLSIPYSTTADTKEATDSSNTTPVAEVFHDAFEVLALDKPSPHANNEAVDAASATLLLAGAA